MTCTGVFSGFANSMDTTTCHKDNRTRKMPDRLSFKATRVDRNAREMSYLHISHNS